MFNFKNLFRNQRVDDIIDQIKARGAYTVAYPDAPEYPPKKESNDACYMVGTTADGTATQIRVGNTGLSSTLTLSPASVAIMIKQLAATIDRDYTVTVKENEIA
jgi:hypothetical protein